MENSNNVASMAKIGLHLKLKALIDAERKLANRREDDASREWSPEEGGEPYPSTRLHHMNRSLAEAIGQALREAGRADADANLVRAIQTLEAILREGKGRGFAWFDVPHERRLQDLKKARPPYVPREEAPGQYCCHGSTNWRRRQEFRRQLSTIERYRTRIVEWRAAIRTIRGYLEKPRFQPVIERPTRPVSMRHAAVRWFKIDRRILTRLVHDGEIRAEAEGSRWLFDLDEVIRRNPECDSDADPTLYRRKG